MIAAREKIALEKKWEQALASGAPMREVFGLPAGRAAR